MAEFEGRTARSIRRFLQLAAYPTGWPGKEDTGILAQNSIQKY